MTVKYTYLFSSILLAATVALTGCKNTGQQGAASTVTITEESTELEKVGYSLGFMMGQGNRQVINDLNLDAYNTGFRDSYNEKEPAISEEDMQKILMEYQQKKEKEMIEEMKQKSEANKAAGEKFLAENKAKEGVKTTASGLQYKVITEGSGESPKTTDIVKVNYEGKLIDGTVFDSSYERGEPIEFPLGQVIKGWTEGVQLMKKGAKYEFYIPSELAYGEAGNPGIEPNSTLLFTVELLDFKAGK